MYLPVTVITVAFGNPITVSNWAKKWSALGIDCLIANNGSPLSIYLGERVKILPSIGNIGYGAGINRAVLEAKTPVILVTNPDTLPASNSSLLDLFNCHKEGFITGAVNINSDGKIVHSSGIWPDVGWIKSQIFRSASTLWRSERYDWLQGSLLMIHKKDFLRIGGFDVNYPLYFEDVDLCARAKTDGMAIQFCKESKFIHDEGSGAERVTATRLFCFHWGLYQFFKTHAKNEPELVVIKRLLYIKCIVRMLMNSIFRPAHTRGYFIALRAIFKNTPPSLPKAVDE